MTVLVTQGTKDSPVVIDGKVAVAYGLVYPLTRCCAGSGKGSANVASHVVCRSCHREVDSEFGGCVGLNDQGSQHEVRYWLSELHGIAGARADAIVAEMNRRAESGEWQS